jgi:homopolymeric O-antigen transport system permease protein
MARVALPTRWVGMLTRQRGPLRMYQWLWLLLCTVGGLTVAAPRILSQPIIYNSTATVQIDTTMSGRSELFNQGVTDPDFIAVRDIAVELLRFKRDPAQQLNYPTLGSPMLNVQFDPQVNGTITISAIGPNSQQAQALADDAAEALARSIRAAGGREIFRTLMGWEQHVAFSGNPPANAFQRVLREINLTSAFPLNRPIDMGDQPITVQELTAENRSDLARAFEVRDVELSEIDLPALRDQSKQAQIVCPDDVQTTDAPQICRDVRRLTTGLAAIRFEITYLQGTALATSFNPDAPSSAFRSARAAPGTEVPHYISLLLALAALVGLVFGGIGVIVDRSAGVMLKLRELWSYRELIRNLVLRDLRVRYKASAFGYLWTQIAPLLMMLVFWLVFSFFMSSGGIAMFPIFLIVALLPWNFCAEAVAGGARSVIDNANLIKKVFFPREVLPLVSVLSSLVNYLLSLPVMFVVMAIVQLLYPPLLGRLNFSWTFAYLPVLVIIQTLFLAGVALFMSALAVSFRDTVHLVGILIQFWFFLTPVVYSLKTINVSERAAQAIRWLNPMASLIDFYRDILYGNIVSGTQVPTPGLPALASILRVLLTALIMLALGYWFFQRRSGRFGEEI